MKKFLLAKDALQTQGEMIHTVLSRLKYGKAILSTQVGVLINSSMSSLPIPIITESSNRTAIIGERVSEYNFYNFSCILEANQKEAKGQKNTWLRKLVINSIKEIDYKTLGSGVSGV